MALALKTLSGRAACTGRVVSRKSKSFLRSVDNSATEPAPATVDERTSSTAESSQTAAPPAWKQPSLSGPGTVSITDIMAFSGPGPEVINGRLAMLGFVAAAAAELASGKSVLKQWAMEPTLVTLAFVLFISASFVPLLNGTKATKVGPFTPQAELLNGRAAMIGFAALLVIETLNHGSAFL